MKHHVSDQITIVKDGRTDYSIFVDPSAPASVKVAANELKEYFRKVTGVDLSLVIGEEPPKTPLISLGITVAAREAGLDVSGIALDGFRMVTRDGNVFILGPDTPDNEVTLLGGVCTGTANGVFTFIEEYLGVEWLMPGELGEEYSQRSTLSIPVIDRVEASPFNYRQVCFRENWSSEQSWDRHQKLGKVSDIATHHSWLQTIHSSNFEAHPDWFALNEGRRVPPFGYFGKLDTTNPELVKAFADEIIRKFRANPNLKWHSLSPSDGGGFSETPESLALVEKAPLTWGNPTPVVLAEGDADCSLSYTPLILKFYNDVARLVGKEFPDRKVAGFIYGQYCFPPNAGMPKLEPNLVLSVAGFFLQHFRLYRPGMLELNDRLFQLWGELAQKGGFDVYWSGFPISYFSKNAILLPIPPDQLNFIFSRLKRCGYKGARIYGNPIWPVFGAGNYISAKLMWNPDLDCKTHVESRLGCGQITQLFLCQGLRFGGRCSDP